MTRYTASHWGIYEIERDATGAPRILPLTGDPDPSPIGLHQLDPALLEARVRRPSVRKSWLEHGAGAAPHLRGREPFIEVSWERALDLVAAEVDRVRKLHGNEAIFGGSYGWASAGRFHHAQSQVHRFLNLTGGYVRHTESYSLGAAHVIMPLIAGTMADLMADHTSWDVMAEHTKLFVTFGGVPRKNSQSSPGLAGKHRVHEGLQAMGQAGTRFINVGPCCDNLDTGTAVEWLATKPHTDTALMLGLAWQLQAEDLHDRDFLASHCTGFDRFLAYLTGETDGVAKTPAWAARICGVSADRIERLAREMAAIRTMLNIQWSLQRAHHGEQPFWALTTLAAMLGQIGLPGGGFGVGYGPANTMGSRHRRMSGPSLDQFRNPVSAYIPCARISDMLLNPGAPFTHAGRHLTFPDIHMIYWAGGNPFHHHQDLNRLIRAWQKPASIIVHDPYWTATARFADVVLPVTTAMERNDIGYATQEGYFVAMRKVVEAYGEAQDDYAIFSGIAERLGLGDAFTEGRDEMAWLRHLYDGGRAKWDQQGVLLPEFDSFWEDGLVDLEFAARSQVMFDKFRADPTAHPLTTPTGKIEITSASIEGYALPGFAPHPVWREPVEWLGAPRAARYPLHLLSDQPGRKLHSQLDPSAHSASGKIKGREPIYINPLDAAARGIFGGDIVEVFNSRGRCLAGVILTEDLMPGVVRISTGAWYDGRAEDGLEKHGNPNVLTLDIPASPLSQGCAAQTCLVEVSGPVANPPPVTAFNLPQLIGE
ncbi:molybdopterin guanine dinucleotide-containing S/N-oxide reductase [Paracoccus actinidiae]|uniref:molybdopterin guanine dinucleotide-containing S/N-oxide reductase n=1 Tax=Paracoccus actinidiae TaxID=3064531 RepID=UPI0027D2F63C|nr:molybdopterin guanine dinucleotide-containing S/N-oxide reductase [Paracoccus sp. M09]